jgi:uncharacterized protein YkwD
MKILLNVLVAALVLCSAQIHTEPNENLRESSTLPTASKAFSNSNNYKFDVERSRRVYEIVNILRSRGCKCEGRQLGTRRKLKWSYKLSQIAANHSYDMKTRDYYSHISPEGEDHMDRIRKTGVTTYFPISGENIAMGQSSPEEVVRTWLSSPGHCRNMMGSSYRWIGIGECDGYWTLVLTT